MGGASDGVSNSCDMSDRSSIAEMPSLNRRDFLRLLAGATLSADSLAKAGPHEMPVSVQLRDPVSVPDSHGDTWVAALTEEGDLYSPSDDTFGFGKATDSNIAFNRLDGVNPLRLTGTTINPMSDYGRSTLEGPDGCTWKSSGCTYIDGALYWVVARHKYGERSGDPRMRQTVANASIIRSQDHGRTWSRPERENMNTPMFPGHRFATPYFLQSAGAAAGDNTNRYVYAISNNGFWDNGDDMILGRVSRSKIAALQGEDWEYFTGGDGRAAKTWTRNMREAKPVLERPGKLGMTGAVYIPARRRYLMIGWYYPAGGGKLKDAATETVWDFYESFRPWGPWKRISSSRFKPQGFYCPQICPKFVSADRVYVLTAGNWNDPRYYQLTVVPADLS